MIATTEALSFWGGVDPATGRVIDVHHPLHGTCLTGGVLFMPTSRGSCTGSGVLLDLILTGRAPSALVFCEAEDVLTLGALIAAEMFGKPLPVLRLDAENFARFSEAVHVRIDETAIEADGVLKAKPSSHVADLGPTSGSAFLVGRVAHGNAVFAGKNDVFFRLAKIAALAKDPAMCCFSGNVTFVRGTRIFTRMTEPGRQAIVYQMEFGAKQDLAMILPLPVAKGAN